MAFKIDFIKDVAARCTDRLAAAGYTVRPADDHDTFRTYVSIRHRRIRPRRRTVHKAPHTVPAHLSTGEQQLLAKVAAGGDLWPHQSRGIGNVAAEDGMLNDYGIQHFHLGTTPDTKRPHLIQGTEELLFAVVNEDDFYALGVFDHKAWSKQALLDIIKANWPHLLAPYTINNGPHMKVCELRHNYTDEEVAKLRATGVNTLQQRPDGTIHIGMGGGITGDGKSMAVTRETDRFIDYVEKLQGDAVTKLEEKIATGRLPADAAVCLEWRNDVPFAVTDPSAVEVDLTKVLIIPPL